MCGICGVVRFTGGFDAGEAKRSVEAMMEALAHRGPDQMGWCHDAAAVIGATRLAIRGLDDGDQPLQDAATGVVVVCNGEIDNHRELRTWLASRGREVASTCDVAVLPGLYLELGEAMVERLRGAFALAVWDPRTKRLLLARDRAGERPLFFECRQGSVRFATELSALASGSAGRPAVSIPDLHRFLDRGVFCSPQTPLQGIEKLGAAEIAVVTASGVRRRRYWRWGEVSPSPPRSPVEAVEAFDAVFREAVRLQTDVDVDFGIFLSGGLDSSLVAAVARSLHPEGALRAYTIRFEEASYDEGGFAEEVAASLGLECATLWMGPGDVAAGLARLVRCAGEPLADPAWLPTALLAQRARRDVRMVLVGEGADELFGGYPTYLGGRLADGFSRLPGPLRRSLRRAVEAWPPTERKVALSFLLKRLVAADGLTGLERHRFWTANIPPSLLARLGVAPPAGDPARSDEGAPLDVAQRFDLETSLAEGLLTKADRGGMSAALELRAPFLDQRVMEFAATLPEEERVSGATTKVFLKRYARRHLPRRIVERRKRGLSLPLSAWLRGPLHEWARTRLGSGRLDAVGVSSKAALALLDEHVSRRVDHARPLWSLAVLVEWLDVAPVGASAELLPAAATAADPSWLGDLRPYSLATNT